MKIILTKTQPQ